MKLSLFKIRSCGQDEFPSHVCAQDSLDNTQHIDATLRHQAFELKIPFYSAERIKAVYDKHDADGSGELDYDEFESVFLELLAGDEGVAARARRERSGGGGMSPPTDEAAQPDYAALLEAFPKSRIQIFWRVVDQDQSGLIDFPEFLNWFYWNFEASKVGKEERIMLNRVEAVRARSGSPGRGGGVRRGSSGRGGGVRGGRAADSCPGRRGRAGWRGRNASPVRRKRRGSANGRRRGSVPFEFFGKNLIGTPIALCDGWVFRWGSLSW